MQFLQLASVCKKFDCSRSTLYRWMNDPASGFPQPARLAGVRTLFWSIAELDKWGEDQLAARNGGAK